MWVEGDRKIGTDKSLGCAVLHTYNIVLVEKVFCSKTILYTFSTSCPQLLPVPIFPSLTTHTRCLPVVLCGGIPWHLIWNQHRPFTKVQSHGMHSYFKFTEEKTLVYLLKKKRYNVPGPFSMTVEKRTVTSPLSCLVTRRCSQWWETCYAGYRRKGEV